MNESEALSLWDDLKRGFINQERILVQIINEKAWEPLGYTSFVLSVRGKVTYLRRDGVIA